MPNYTTCSSVIYNYIVKSWYKPFSWFTLLLLPFSLLFRCIVYLRRKLYQTRIKKTSHFSVPVIVIGNITVGGTGKTPLVIAITKFLKNKGFSPGIVSRGYGAKKLTSPRLVSTNDRAEAVGDEPLIIARNTESPVVIFSDRVTAVKHLLATQKCDVVISDDGLQHYAMGREIEVAVIDGKRQLGNGYCLPAGPLREPASRLKEADCLVYNGAVHNGTNEQEKAHHTMMLKPQNFISVADSTRKTAIKLFKNQLIHAVAGIGNPERFFLLLRELGFKVIEHAFPDHHSFVKQDIDFKDAIVIMTEKDAVKCEDFADHRHWYLSVVANIDENFTNSLLSNLEKLRLSRKEYLL